jgi:hypothetical protein
MPSTGGPEEKMLDLVQAVNWLITSGGIYFTDESPNSAVIRYLDFATRKTWDVLHTPRPLFLGLDISPDKKWLVWSQYDRFDSGLMLVDNFH